jgi:hypothetical protein
LTKATAYIFALPFGVWVGAFLIKKNPKNVARGLLIVALVVLVNSEFLIRNFLLFSNPLGTGQMFQMANQIHTFGALVSNLIRNTALNFADKQNPFFRSILSYLQLLHEFTGYTNTDPGTSLYDWNIFSGFTRNTTLHEDFAGNPIHAILIFMTVVFSFYSYRKSKIHPNVMILGINLVFSFLLFSYYLKFQIGGSRLLLPMFVLWAPVNILILGAINERVVKICVVGILICSFHWTFGNISRGINQESLSKAKNREQIYFVNNPSQYLGYSEISDRIKSSGCQAIGLSIGEDTSEYPLWIMLADRKWHGRIEHVNVANPTSILEDKDFLPCVIISDNPDVKVTYQGLNRTKIDYFYLPENTYIYP